MSAKYDGKTITAAQAEEVALKAAQAFSPRAPVSERELFAGRREQVEVLLDALLHKGLHAVVYGEPGVGKTSLANVVPELALSEASRRGETLLVVRTNANTGDTFSSVWSKAFDEIWWEEDKPVFGPQRPAGKQRVTFREAAGLGDALDVDRVRRALKQLPRSVMVIDEFDRLPKRHVPAFTDLIKVLSDQGVGVTLVLVGVAETVEGLIRDHASVSRALVQTPIPRMTREELIDILRRAERVMEGVVRFTDEAAARIAAVSQGLPHYTHLLGLHAARAAAARGSGEAGVVDVTAAFRTALRQTERSIAEQYETGVRSAHSAALHAKVLLACALTVSSRTDGQGYFQPVQVGARLAPLLGRAAAGVSVYNKHLLEFCEEKRGRVLERQGRARSYRYRFRDPLLLPYVLLRGLSEGVIGAEGLEWAGGGDRG